MERIFISRLVGALILCFTCILCYGQDNYYVFKKSGNPTKNTDKILDRGAAFLEADTLNMGKKDHLLLVNELGELFEITIPNNYAYSAIADYQRKLEENSFTKKYFTFVWKQFTNQHKRRQEAGVVYREERKIKLIAPQDSVKLYSPEVHFSWKNNTDKTEQFFFLRDLKSGHLTKIGITGSTIELNLDNLLLKSDQAYEWSVAVSSFPNLNELKFNRLNMLSKADYEKLKKEMTSIIKAFKLLGFSESEILEAICLDYKFCTF